MYGLQQGEGAWKYDFAYIMYGWPQSSSASVTVYTSATVQCSDSATIFFSTSSEGRPICSKSFLRGWIHFSLGLSAGFSRFLGSSLVPVWRSGPPPFSTCPYHVTLLCLIIVSSVSSPVHFLTVFLCLLVSLSRRHPAFSLPFVVNSF